MKKRSIRFLIWHTLACQLQKLADSLFKYANEAEPFMPPVDKADMDAGQPDNIQEQSIASEQAELPPAHWLARQAATEIPADWLRRVQQGAPELLTRQVQTVRTGASPVPAFPTRTAGTFQVRQTAGELDISLERLSPFARITETSPQPDREPGQTAQTSLITSDLMTIGNTDGIEQSLQFTEIVASHKTAHPSAPTRKSWNQIAASVVALPFARVSTRQKSVAPDSTPDSLVKSASASVPDLQFEEPVESAYTSARALVSPGTPLQASIQRSEQKEGRLSVLPFREAMEEAGARSNSNEQQRKGIEVTETRLAIKPLESVASTPPNYLLQPALQEALSAVDSRSKEQPGRDVFQVATPSPLPAQEKRSQENISRADTLPGNSQRYSQVATFPMLEPLPEYGNQYALEIASRQEASVWKAPVQAGPENIGPPVHWSSTQSLPSPEIWPSSARANAFPRSIWPTMPPVQVTPAMQRQVSSYHAQTSGTLDLNRQAIGHWPELADGLPNEKWEPATLWQSWERQQRLNEEQRGN